MDGSEGQGGRIPFRIRIGVTGHRTIEEDAALLEGVRAQIERVAGLVGSARTAVRLSVVSQLAEGADRIVVREALASDPALEPRLEAFLPLERDRYAEAQGFGAESRRELDRLLGAAVVRREPLGQPAETAEDRVAAFEATSRQIVARCDVLIALWDGRPAGGRGGTAATLDYAAARGKPCIWISTAAAAEVTDNLAPGSAAAFHREVADRAMPEAASEPVAAEAKDVLASLRGSFEALDEYNREPDRLDEDDVLTALDPAAAPGDDAWVREPYGRATALATRWHQRFKWMARIIPLLVTLAAGALATSLTWGEGEALWSWAEAVLLTLALALVLLVRRVGFHRRWLSYRLLAERLRSAYYLAPTGVDFRRQARLEPVYSGSSSSSWLMRAFEEVWDRRPGAGAAAPVAPRGDFERLRRDLAEVWVGGQIGYHQRMRALHGRWHRALVGAAGVLFLATVVFACLHSRHVWEHASVFFSILLPAAAAALGVLLSVNPHQALSERSERTVADLEIAKRDLLDARPDALAAVSSEAARVIAQESGTWFGSMWFHDIEHP